MTTCSAHSVQCAMCSSTCLPCSWFKLPCRWSGKSSEICSHFIANPPRRNSSASFYGFFFLRAAPLELMKSLPQFLQRAMNANAHSNELAADEPRDLVIFQFLESREDENFSLL